MTRAVVEARAILGPFWSSWDLDADLSENVFEDLVRVIDAALRERERAAHAAGVIEGMRTPSQECTEPDHVDLEGMPYHRVHCITCTDRAVDNARRATWRAASEVATEHANHCRRMWEALPDTDAYWPERRSWIVKQETCQTVAAALAAKGEA